MRDGLGTAAGWLRARIESSCDFYKAQGWGRFERVAEPMTFVGVYNGTAVAFEGNTVAGHSFAMSMIRPSRKFLEEFASAGGVSFVLIEFEAEREIYAASLEWLAATAGASPGNQIPLIEFRLSEGKGRGLKQVSPGLAGVHVPFGLVLEPVSEKVARRAAG